MKNKKNNIPISILNHFKSADPIMYSLLLSIDEAIAPTKSTNYFISLCREIIYQQLSDKAGGTIYKRFEALFPNNQISPDSIFSFPSEAIRACGTSNAKVAFIKSLAQHFIDKTVNFETIHNLSDEEVIEALTKIKGIGPWTAEMFLMFSLGRADVFSHGDVGLKNGIKKVYQYIEYPSRDKIETLTNKWSPYRTYACLALWRSLG